MHQMYKSSLLITEYLELVSLQVPKDSEVLKVLWRQRL
jgi:hypothetical protein